MAISMSSAAFVSQTRESTNCALMVGPRRNTPTRATNVGSSRRYREVDVMVEVMTEREVMMCFRKFPAPELGRAECGGLDNIGAP